MLLTLAAPDDPQSWNGYAYARNNPLKYTDPGGELYTVCDEHGQNCGQQSHQQFDQNKQNTQQQGEVWKMGTILSHPTRATVF
jgi:hypothetical protein